MRAGSLSANDIVRRLKKDFVCAWDNTDGECNAGGSFAHPPSDPPPQCIRGNGEHNVQMLFLTPDRKLLHIVAGYVSAPELVQEIDFAKNLYELVKRAKTDTAKKHLIVNAHKQALRETEKREFTGPLSDWAKRRVLADHKFAQKHPLLPASGYRSEDHVGRSTTFFGSSTNGRPKEGIGTPRPKLPKTPGASASATSGTPSDELLEKILESADIPEEMKKRLREKLGK